MGGGGGCSKYYINKQGSNTKVPHTKRASLNSESTKLYHHLRIDGNRNYLGLKFNLSQIFEHLFKKKLPGRIAQSVTCLATDACLTADPGVASSIPAWSHTFVEIDHEIISTVVLLPSADPFKKGCCQ